MKAELFDLKGKKVEKGVQLNDAVWKVAVNPDLVAQVVYVYQNNKRTGTAAAKGRGDVSGGGRKPWKQKGTGRARSGSTRSPIWVGGGVTFAPTGSNWLRKINKKMARKALSMALSEKLNEKLVMFYELPKEVSAADLREMMADGVKTLFVTSNGDAYKAVRNMENVTVVESDSLNLLDVLNTNRVCMIEDQIAKLETRLADGK